MRNLKSALLLGAAVALGTTACTKPADDAVKPGSAAATSPAAAPAVTVNGTKLSTAMVDTFVQAVTGKPAAELQKEQRDEIVDELVNMTLVAQAAEKDGLTKDPEVQARIDLLRTQVLAQMASEKYAETHPVSDDEVKKEFDEQVAKMPKEYKARHILVEQKETAESIIRELAAGGDFAALAKKESKDPGSAANGGDLGWFSGQSMVKPFSDAVAALEKGATTKEPVQTQYGWHVIKLEDSRQPEAPAFEDVKDQVKQFAQRKKIQTYVEELRKTAKIQK